MAYINHLDGNDFFIKDSIPIKVLKAEHNKGDNIYHSHSFYEFVYIERGFSTHFYNETTTLLMPGDVFGMRPGDVHGYVYPKNTILYNCLFNYDALGEDMDKIKSLPGLNHILDPGTSSVWQRISLGPGARKEALSYLEEMRLESENLNIGWEVKLKGLLMEFLILFSRTFLKQYRKEDEDQFIYTQYIYKALNYIENQYIHGIMVEELADYVGLSMDYFTKMFKQFTGLTPIEYVKSVRLAKAVELLRNSNKAISRVAQEVGFEDPSYFSRQFKQVLGMSPSEFQKENSQIL